MEKKIGRLLSFYHINFKTITFIFNGEEVMIKRQGLSFPWPGVYKNLRVCEF